MRPWLRLSNLLLLILAIVLGVGLYFVIYLLLATSPYEAVGMAINQRLPKPVREMTCGILSKRHPGTWPIAGCERMWGSMPPAPEAPLPGVGAPAPASGN